MSFLMLYAVFTTPKKLYINELKDFQSVSESDQKFIQESDIFSLPDPVQRYLNYTGYAGAPQSDVTEVLWADSKIRFSPEKKWMPLSTQQYNFSSSSARLAYMHTRIAGVLPFEGRDRYHEGSGHMYGKLAKAITVFNNRSLEVALGGAVILLAEALLEPTIALQDYITWVPVDFNTAKATLRNGNLEVSGRFYINDIGEYIRFESDDRPYDVGKGVYETRPFSINLGEYRETDGYKIPSRVSATWHLEKEDFTYWVGQISGLRRNIDRIPNTNQEMEFTTARYDERYGLTGTVNHSLFINPFEIAIEPMQRLLLINIEKDPDTLYIGFEPQVFNDEIMGAGLLVIAWRVDGKVDVYHQPSLSPDPSGYDIVGKGLENMVSRELQDAFFEVNEQGAQAEVRFEDIEGRVIELKLTEQSNRARKPFGLLAPMGFAAENPSAMPLILLHDFYFVRRNNTELSVKIDGREHTPDKLPLPIDFTRMTFARYCPDPLIVKLNPEIDGLLTAIPLDDDLILKHDNHNIDLILNRDIAEIQSISRSHNRHTLSLTFNPAFPNLKSFVGESTEGEFEIFGDPSTGFIRGEYKVVRSGDRFSIEMIPSGGWIPNADKLSLRFLYTVQPIFKKWPTTYRWTAELEQDPEAGFRMKSKWERISADETE